MKGTIYTDQKCEICQGVMRHDENRDGCYCSKHPEVKAQKKFRVQFGRDLLMRFNLYKDARDFLNGMRWKAREESFDARDYKADNPLGFETQILKWLSKKEANDDLAVSTKRNIKRDVYKAIEVFGQKNIKAIRDAEIEDFLDDLPVGNKTKSNTESVLHDFWSWLCRREKIPMPEFPGIEYTLGWREIVSFENQLAILDRIKEDWDQVNPKIHIGIKWLATYPSIRPNELIGLKHKHINVNGCFIIPRPKEKTPKMPPMTASDIELYKEMCDLYPALPATPFFRHIKGNGTAKPNSKFGKDYLYKKAKASMKSLGVGDVDLYGLTKHSTMTALGDHFSEDELMKYGSIHKTDKAFRRYMQKKKDSSLKIHDKVLEMRGELIELRKVK